MKLYEIKKDVVINLDYITEINVKIRRVYTIEACSYTLSNDEFEALMCKLSQYFV